MSRYEMMLRDAYNGELFGHAVFSEMAAHDEWSDHREALEALAAIEQRTATALRPLVDAAGVDPGDAEEPRRQGRELGAGGGSWDAFIKALFEGLPPFLANFVQLRELAPDPHDPALTALVDHELAISAFAQLEVSGHHGIAPLVLTRYLETAP